MNRYTHVKVDDLSNLLCDLEDIRRTLPRKVLGQPKDNDGTDFTIGDLLDDAVDTLRMYLSDQEADA